MNAPYMQNVLQQLSSNPEMASQLIGNNPILSGNPQFQEQIRTMLPTMMSQMQNPEMQSILTNPQAIQVSYNCTPH
jgi:ubiquilin